MIAERMKLIVENSGESQSTIAERLGVSQPRLNQYLNGKREADQAFITRFCRYFHTTPNSLFEFEAEQLSEDALNLFANIIDVLAGAKKTDPFRRFFRYFQEIFHSLISYCHYFACRVIY